MTGVYKFTKISMTYLKYDIVKSDSGTVTLLLVISQFIFWARSSKLSYVVVNKELKN